MHPRRIVSLVPSLTYTVVRLGGADRLVGRSRYCCSPAADVAGIPALGGTKDPDLAAILRLQPDLILLDRDENRREDARILAEAGGRIVTFHPTRVEDVVTILDFLGQILEASVAAHSLGRALLDVLHSGGCPSATPVPALCLIWMAPYMSCNGRTYMSDVLQQAGFQNILQEHPQRYFPLCPEALAEKPYPSPVVLLPTEPFAFTEEHIAVVSHDFRIPPERIRRVKGEYLAWYGAITAEALTSLARLRETFSADAKQ